MDAPAGVTQEEGHTGFLRLPSVVLAFVFIAKWIQPFLSLVNSVKSNFVYPRINCSPLLVGYDFYLFISLFVRKNPTSCDCTEIRTHVPTSEGFEVAN